MIPLVEVSIRLHYSPIPETDHTRVHFEHALRDLMAIVAEVVPEQVQVTFEAPIPRRGSLVLIATDDSVRAINLLQIETFLKGFDGIVLNGEDVVL